MPRMLAIDYSSPARPYVAPDHGPGERFPGTQAPTTQLSLYSVGFAKRHATPPPTPCVPAPEAVEVAPETPETQQKGTR